MTLNAMLNATEFRLAAAFAPVVNWKYFDALYTERYLGTPADNKAGYQNAAMDLRASGLNTLKKLLLVHGTDDATVHLAHSMRMVDACQVANKPFSVLLMVYPHSGHVSFFDFGSKPVELFAKLSSFFITNLELVPAVLRASA